MENFEKRLQKLENKYRNLRYLVICLIGFVTYSGVTGLSRINSIANAQATAQRGVRPNTAVVAKRPAVLNSNQVDVALEQSHQAKAAKVPVVLEAQVFILRDKQGNIRGVWSAEDETTSFAMMHKESNPMIAMAVDKKNSSFSMSDVYGGKINASLNDSIRSIAITDESRKNNVYMGLSASGESSIDLVSTGKSSLIIDGEVSSLDLSGDSSIIALTETVGSAVAIKAIPSTSAITFLDHSNKTTMDLTTIDGKTQMKIVSPKQKEEKVITSAPEVAVQAFDSSSAVVPLGAKESEKSEQVSEKKVDMKTYSPFSK